MRHSHLAVATVTATMTATALGASAQGLVLPPIVVSAGLTPAPSDVLGRAHTVVSGDEIRAQGAVYAVDALRGLPGVAVSRTGGPGGLTAVRLRGNEDNHTVVLIDGVEVSSPESGAFDFGGLLAADIASIEILRGPQSALFGSNAIGGVISIHTNDATEPGVVRGGGFRLGTDGSVGGEAFVRARGERGGLSFSLAGEDIEGFDVSESGGDDDGTSNVTLNLRGDASLGEDITVGGSLRYVDRSFGYDDFFWGAPTRDALVFDAPLTSERQELSASLWATAQALGGRVEHGPFLGFTREDGNELLDGVRTTDTTGERQTLRYQAKVALDAPTLDAADHSLTLAAEWQRETYGNNDAALVFSPSQLEEQSRELFGLIAEYRGAFPWLDLQAGLRRDDNDDFEDTTTYSVALSAPVQAADLRLHASVGTGVQNPTMFEQFGFIPDQFIGNADLVPEESFGWDAGVEKTFAAVQASLDITYFNQRLEDEIVTVFLPDGTSTAVNEDGRSDREGVEVAATWQATEALALDAAYTYLHARNDDGSREVRRPGQEARLSASYGFRDRGQLRIDGIYVRDNYDSDYRAGSGGFPEEGAQVKLDDYVLLNVAGSWQVKDGVTLFGGVNNLLDADYEEIHGYGTEGVTAFAGLRASW